MVIKDHSEAREVDSVAQPVAQIWFAHANYTKGCQIVVKELLFQAMSRYGNRLHEAAKSIKIKDAPCYVKVN